MTTKPDDIPQDIRTAALEIAKGWGLDEFSVGAHAFEIASAILAERNAEREACALVIERLADEQEAINQKYPEHVQAYPSWETYPANFHQAADAIRNLKHKTEV